MKIIISPWSIYIIFYIMLMPYMLFGRFSLFFKLTLRSSFNFFRLLSFVKIPNSLSFSLIDLISCQWVYLHFCHLIYLCRHTGSLCMAIPNCAFPVVSVSFLVGPCCSFTMRQVLNLCPNKKDICWGIPFVWSLQMHSSTIIIKFFHTY